MAALALPIYGSATLIEENGRGVLLVMSMPAVVSAAAWIALWRRCTRGGRVSEYVAWGCVGVLTVLSLVGILTVGVFVLPVALMLALAAAWAPSGSPPGSSPEALV